MTIEIETIVKVKNTTKRCNLYTLFIHAAQGDFKEQLDSGDKEKINDIETMIKKEFDLFANHYFKAGIDYQKGKNHG